MNDLADLEGYLSEILIAADHAQRIASDHNEYGLATELRKMRERARLHRARLIEHLMTADVPQRRRTGQVA